MNEKKNMNEENIKALDELSKGACMGMDAINFVLKKIEDPEFKNSVEVQYQKYQDIEIKIRKVYKKYSQEEKPQETSMMNKAMTWYGIEMKTLTDTSNSKIAELLLNGTNMGIIEGRKMLNNKNVNKEVIDIMQEYITMQEDSVEQLKKFL